MGVKHSTRRRFPHPVGSQDGLPTAHTAVLYTSMTPLVMAAKGVPHGDGTEATAESVTLIHWQVDPPSQGGSVYLVEVSLPLPSSCHADVQTPRKRDERGSRPTKLNVPGEALLQLYASGALESLRLVGHTGSRTPPLWAHVHTRSWIITPRCAKRSTKQRSRLLQQRLTEAVASTASGDGGVQLQEWLRLFGGSANVPLRMGVDEMFLGQGGRDVDVEGCDVTFIESVELQPSLSLNLHDTLPHLRGGSANVSSPFAASSHGRNGGVGGGVQFL
jgi:hypothetical protein